MIKTESKLMLNGISGKQYLFDLYVFDLFDELKEAFAAKPAIYLFTRRSPSVEGFTHDLVYLGETEDLSRRFVHHHKEDCIVSHHSNCIGLHAVSQSEEERKAIEEDILSAYDFPCNNQHNS